MKQISILGCGWLGFPLAKNLIANNFCVLGSTTTPSKMTVLKNAHINPYLISVNETQINGNIQDFLKNTEILIVDIPPKLRGNTSENFVAKIEILISQIEISEVKKIIFVSSTSVYADDNKIVTEKFPPNPDSESGKQLLFAEQLFANNKNFETIILRFGGLIGEDRHPIHFLVGRKNIENPNAPINLVHQQDCIAIIVMLIQESYGYNKSIWNEIYNVVAPYHPTRKIYYTQKAIEKNLPIPAFDLDKPTKGKTVLSDKIINVLNYKFSELMA